MIGQIQKNILGSQNLSNKNKVKNLLYYEARKRGAERSWKNRHQKVFEFNSSYAKSTPINIKDEHKKVWAPFRDNVDLNTLKICQNISGIADPRYIPEDIFVSDIESTLLIEDSIHFLSHKSFYNQWFDKGIFPKDILHRINGEYLDPNLKPVTWEQIQSVLTDVSYPVVMKPNKDSYGGKNIHFVKSKEELVRLVENEDNFVVQEQILQHDFFSKFNPIGLNTIRVYIYRSVIDHQLHILSTTLRMGKGGSLDNETDGGIHCLIKPNGHLNGYAVDKFCRKYSKHPDTGYLFEGIIPGYDQLKSLALAIAGKVFFSHIVGLDMCCDTNNQWRVIELNTKGHTIRFSQYGGSPFFGEFTSEVIEFCKNNHWSLR